MYTNNDDNNNTKFVFIYIIPNKDKLNTKQCKIMYKNAEYSISDEGNYSYSTCSISKKLIKVKNNITYF